MNPEENKPAENAPTTAPEMNGPSQESAQPSAPIIDNVVAPASPQVAPTVTDTISPDQPQTATPAEVQDTSVPEAPAQSGVINATSPITDTKAVEPSDEDPGHTMSVAGLVLAIFMPLIGLVVSIIARSKSKKAGHKNGLALAGIIVSIVSLIVSIAVGALIVLGVNKTLQFCDKNGPGTHTTDSGATIVCDE